MHPEKFVSTRHIVSLLLCMSLFLYDSDACFIRNCPPGGKRSLDILQQGVRECLSCGPGNRGQCVGTNICCGDFGCLMGTKDSEICAKENDSSVPCSIKGQLCGVRNRGKCVGDGICCDFDTCSLNSKCKINSDRGNSEILSLINQLLEDSDYRD